MPAKIEHLPATEPHDVVLEVLERDGVVILEGLVEPDQLQRINGELDPFMATAARYAHRRSTYDV